MQTPISIPRTQEQRLSTILAGIAGSVLEWYDHFVFYNPQHQSTRASITAGLMGKSS